MNALLTEVDRKKEKERDTITEKPLKHQVPLHSKIFAARLLSLSQPKHNLIDKDGSISQEMPDKV